MFLPVNPDIGLCPLLWIPLLHLTLRLKNVFVFFSAVKIKKNKNNVKFKVRCSRFLYTLVIEDREKAEKLKQSLPPGRFTIPSLGTAYNISIEYFNSLLECASINMAILTRCDVSGSVYKRTFQSRFCQIATSPCTRVLYWDNRCHCHLYRGHVTDRTFTEYVFWLMADT